MLSSSTAGSTKTSSEYYYNRNTSGKPLELVHISSPTRGYDPESKYFTAAHEREQSDYSFASSYGPSGKSYYDEVAAIRAERDQERKRREEVEQPWQQHKIIG